MPSSAGRPTASPRQNGNLPGWPKAGTTITRSWVISVMRQLVAPKEITSPGRDSYTISSSSSPTREGFSPSAPAYMYTVNRPRSGMAPPDVTASRCAPGRPVSVPASLS